MCLETVVFKLKSYRAKSEIEGRPTWKRSEIRLRSKWCSSQIEVTSNEIAVALKWNRIENEMTEFKIPFIRMVPGGSDGNSFFCTRIATSSTTTPTTPTASLRRYVWAPKTLFAFTVASAYRILAVLSERTLNFSADFFAKPGIPKQHCHVHYLMNCTLKIINRTCTTKKHPRYFQSRPRCLLPGTLPQTTPQRCSFQEFLSQTPFPKSLLPNASSQMLPQLLSLRGFLTNLLFFPALAHDDFFRVPADSASTKRKGGALCEGTPSELRIFFFRGNRGGSLKRGNLFWRGWIPPPSVMLGLRNVGNPFRDSYSDPPLISWGWVPLPRFGILFLRKFNRGLKRTYGRR